MVLWQPPYPASGTTPSSSGGPSMLSGPGGWKKKKKEGNQESSWELSSCHERLKKGPGWPWEQAPQCLQTLGLLHASEHTPLTAPRS